LEKVINEQQKVNQTKIQSNWIWNWNKRTIR
jgi:hypothetical protein